MRQITEIQAVIQKNPSGPTWYAGYGALGTEGNACFSMGAYLEEIHETKQAARTASLEMARAYRNTVLTLGGCTFENLPKIVRRTV